MVTSHAVGTDGTALTGGNGNDVFVFSPEDGRGVGIITDFTGIDRKEWSDREEKIDLTAFNIDLGFEAFREKHIVAQGEAQGGNIVIDLSEFGGGTILLENFGEHLDNVAYCGPAPWFSESV